MGLIAHEHMLERALLQTIKREEKIQNPEEMPLEFRELTVDLLIQQWVIGRQHAAEEKPPHRRLHQGAALAILRRALSQAHLDSGAEVNGLMLVGHNRFLLVGEDQPLAFCSRLDRGRPKSP